MPQASAELRAKFSDDAAARSVLEGLGFTLNKDFCWIPPAEGHHSQDATDAMVYLMTEWDYGGPALDAYLATSISPKAS